MLSAVGLACGPFGGGHPYGIALDDGGKLLRVQCKTGRLLEGGVVFSDRDPVPQYELSVLSGRR
jgi:hypothetical protein